MQVVLCVVGRTRPDVVKKGDAPSRFLRVDCLQQSVDIRGSGKGMERTEEILTTGELLIAIMALVSPGFPRGTGRTPSPAPAAHDQGPEHRAEGIRHAERHQ